MARHYLLMLLLALTLVVGGKAQQPVTFIQHHRDYHIVVPSQQPEWNYAASELQFFLENAFHTRFEICADTDYTGGPAISIGQNRLSEPLCQQYGSALQPDGFLLHSDNNILYIIGYQNDTIANLYGIYHLLENHFGCTYTCANSIHYDALPDTMTLCLHDLQNPAFRYRETLHLIPNIDDRYAKWHKLHTRRDFNREWGLFVHTFKDLIPVDTYFDTHPEWFSEMYGRRVRDGQLCLSNPDVLEELCRNLEKRMQAEPDKQIWSVSQNDNESSCTCERCRHLDSLYGGPSGTMIWFVNQVAERFPDKTISTLAYQQTRHAPTNIRPNKNVNIMLCSIECQRTYPIASETGEHSFQHDMDAWTALTDNIFLWDYVVQFRNYFDPFPNFQVLQPNLQNFRDHHIPMVFEQGSNQNVTESHEWRTYLLAHLMWNPDLNVDSLRQRFFDAYYGPNRTPFITQYYDEMQEALLASGQKLNIYGYPMDAVEGYLAYDKIMDYLNWMMDVLKTQPFEGCMIEQSQIYDERAVLWALPLEFALIDLISHECFPELSFFEVDDKGRKSVREEYRYMLEEFVISCNKLGIKYLDEATYTPQQFYDNITNYWEKNTGGSLAAGKPVACSTEWSNLYDVGGPKALTDGKMGPMDYHYNWLGFWGNDMDVVIDLGKRTTISTVNADFLYYPLSWIFAPVQVRVEVSNDGKVWKKVGEENYENGTNLIECKIVPFRLNFPAVKGRYVRVVAKSLLTNPEWHRGVGQPCWIFCDEIIVR